MVICIRIVRTDGTEADKIRQQISYLEQIQAIAPVLLNLQSTFLKVFNELDNYRVRNLPTHIQEFLQSSSTQDEEWSLRYWEYQFKNREISHVRI